MTHTIREQSVALRRFASAVIELHPGLAKVATDAAMASDDFANWLETQSSSKTGTSGVGKENYTWNLKNVHLIPYSWEEQVLLLQRELARSHTALRLEEQRNKDLPRLTKIDNVEDYDRLFNEAVDEYLQFLQEEKINGL